MSDRTTSDEYDDTDGEGSRRRVPADGRDLEIRLSLQVIGGDDGTPVRVRWVDDPNAGSGRSVGRRRPASSAPGRKALLIGGAAAVIAVAALLGASLFRPAGLSPDRQPTPAELQEPVLPPTAVSEPEAAGVGAEADDEVTAPAPAASSSAVEPPAPAAPVLRFAGDLPSTSRVFVNGEEVRRRTLSLRPGSYQLEVRAPGFAPARVTLRLAAGDDRTWRPTLQPLSLAQAPAPLEVGPARRIVTDAAAVPPEPTRTLAAGAPPVGEPAAEAAPEPDRAALLEAARTEIQGSLDQLVRAFQARNVSELRRVYPAMTFEQEKRWREFLESSDISDLRVTLAYVQPPVVQGDLAEATFDIILQFRTAYSGAVRQPTRYGATLERRTTEWTIRSLEAMR